MSVVSLRSDAHSVDRSHSFATVGQMLLAAVERHTGAALRSKRDGAWIDVGYGDLGADVRAIARGLRALGIVPRDRVALLSSTRPEWTLVDSGALTAGATVVPIYHTNSPEECAYVLQHSQARVVVCEDAAQLAKVAAVRDQCPALQHVIAMRHEDAEGCLSLGELRARGEEVDPEAPDEALRGLTPDDLATIIYTSGTTGPPKGCMITHRNFLAAVRMYEESLEFGESPVVFMFLPLAHSLARVTQMVALDLGATLVFWQGDPALLLDDVRDAQPTHLPSVPRVFEKIHARATGGAEDMGRSKRALFSWALATGASMRAAERGASRPGLLLRGRHALADRLVLSKVRDLFGPELRMAMSGAAPIATDVLEFFSACGVPILEGYGMTETCAAATINRLGLTRFGTVGSPLPSSDVAIAEDGEILMRGPHVFKGYYRDEEATRESFDGEWLRSGDIGELDADGFLRITGRKKELIITSSGKNISPANLETRLRESRWISQAVVYGDNHPYLVAVLTLDPEEAPALAARLGVQPDVAAMAADPRVLAELQHVVDEVNASFARIEQIKRFAVLDHDLTLPGGELTPTLKIKRAVVYDRHRETFEGLYAR
jgi:long-chain acyl-CoA synthetase